MGEKLTEQGEAAVVSSAPEGQNKGMIRQGYCRIHVHLAPSGGSEGAASEREDRIQVDYYDRSRFIRGTVSSSPVEIRVFAVSEYKPIGNNVIELTVGHVIDSGCDGNAINKVVITGVRKGTGGNVNPCKIQGRIEECPPPKFIPIPNNTLLEVRANQQRMEIQVIDRKQGALSIAYVTKEIRLSGVDLRAYGHLIEYTSKTKISVRQTGEGFFLLVSGVNLQIEGLRTVDVSEVRIKSKDAIEVRVSENAVNGPKRPVCQVAKGVAFRDALRHAPWSLYASLAGSILWVFVMTVLPVCFRSAAVSEFQRQVAQLPQVKVEETTTSAPALQPPEELKVSLACGDATNAVNATSAVKTGKEGKSVVSVKFRMLGYGPLCVWFALAVGVYLVLYFLGVIALVLSCRAVRRHRKLNGDISGVIAALRAERDKTVRDRMKKRILDNLLSTYLGERSED